MCARVEWHRIIVGGLRETPNFHGPSAIKAKLSRADQARLGVSK